MHYGLIWIKNVSISYKPSAFWLPLPSYQRSYTFLVKFLGFIQVQKLAEEYHAVPLGPNLIFHIKSLDRK